jgi:hypothetical protein
MVVLVKEGGGNMKSLVVFSQGLDGIEDMCRTCQHYRLDKDYWSADAEHFCEALGLDLVETVCSCIMYKRKEE